VESSAFHGALFRQIPLRARRELASAAKRIDKGLILKAFGEKI